MTLEPNEKDELIADIMKACGAPWLKKWDGNGGHILDKKSITTAVVSGVIVVVCTALLSSVFNRVWNLSSLTDLVNKTQASISEQKDTNQKILNGLDSITLVNKEQTYVINRNTIELYNHSKKPIPALIEVK